MVLVPVSWNFQKFHPSRDDFDEDPAKPTPRRCSQPHPEGPEYPQTRQMEKLLDHLQAVLRFSTGDVRAWAEKKDIHDKISQGETQPKDMLLGYWSLRKRRLLVQILKSLFKSAIPSKRQFKDRVKEGRSRIALRNLHLVEKSLDYKSRQERWYDWFPPPQLIPDIFLDCSFNSYSCYRWNQDNKAHKNRMLDQRIWKNLKQAIWIYH